MTDHAIIWRESIVCYSWIYSHIQLSSLIICSKMRVSNNLLFPHSGYDNWPQGFFWHTKNPSRRTYFPRTVTPVQPSPQLKGKTRFLTYRWQKCSIHRQFHPSQWKTQQPSANDGANRINHSRIISWRQKELTKSNSKLFYCISADMAFKKSSRHRKTQGKIMKPQ